MKRLLKSILSHLRNFYPIWLILFALLITAVLSSRNDWTTIKHIARFILIVFCVLVTLHPLNAVYGLIGTKGHVSTYVMLLIIINVIFSGVYYHMIFQNAGITYDINQPHISYDLFADKPDTTTWAVPSDTTRIVIYNQTESAVSYWNKVGEEHHYQKIDFFYVLKNTFMTSLMQEPSDFFAIASTYNRGVDDFPEDVNRLDQQKSELFHWLLILQVFISWIFFGVFISILYNKFRYES